MSSKFLPSVATVAAADQPGTDQPNPEGGGGGDTPRQSNPGGALFVSQNTHNGSDSSLSRPNSEPANQPPPPDNLWEAGGRFVRGASIEGAGSDVQRIYVLMQDDRLGRIALRMVDRAGLIHAVVRTDGTRAAQLITESLPALLESLSQRGLLASWTSAQGEGQEQHAADQRQGQPRRQRSGFTPGGRRPARSPDPIFQVEAR